jgi:hypothetical protein
VYLRTEIWIEAKFPSLNEWIAAAKKGRGKFNAYSRLKDTFDRVVALQIGAQKPMAYNKVRILFRWEETNRKRDPDNFIAGGRKPIMDGLILAGVISNDGWDNVTGFADTFQCGDCNGVTLILEGDSDGQPARPRARKYPRTESRPARASKGRGSSPVALPRQIQTTHDSYVESLPRIGDPDDTDIC